MNYVSSDDAIVMRLDPGDEICSCIEKVCVEKEIRAAEITGIGTTDNAQIGVYNLAKKEFFADEVHEFCEIVSLCGNASVMDGKPYVHLHATLGSQSGKVFAGHLKSAVVAATAELVIRKIELDIGRRYDRKTGLNIFDF